MTKEERRKFASYMAKLSHKKSPRSKEHYSAMGKKGGKISAERRKAKKEGVDNSAI